VIVFPNPNPDRDRALADPAPRTLVKRVIGLPGDVIAFRDGSPVVNGWVVPSCDAGPYLSVSGSALVRGRLAVEVLGDRTYLTVRPPPGEAPTPPFEVPPGEVYVIGDDRGVSQDSRAWRASSHGQSTGVPIASIEGRVSRLAVGASGDGHLDLAHPFAGLRPVLRQPNLDVTALDRRIVGCLAHPPRSSTPPPAAAAAAGLRHR
jgi:signal peptidase I